MSFPILLWRLLTLKSPAEDMPYSVSLMVVFAFFNMSITALGMSGPGITQTLAAKASVISVLASGACLYGILSIRKLTPRFVQLWTAILAIDTICTIGSVILYRLLGTNGLQFILGLLISTWSWWISVQFLMQAFNVKLWFAIGISFIMQVASVFALLLFLPELSDILSKAAS